MPPLSLAQLYQSYMQLRGQLQQQVITYQQFVDSVRQLQAQDVAGQWWMIDPQTGRYLTYTGNGWVEATPAASQPAAQATQGPARPTPAAQPSQPQAATPSQPVTTPSSKAKRRLGCFASTIMTAVMSVGAGFLWYAYTSLSPSSEGEDLTTPLLIAGTPLLTRLVGGLLGKLMNPLYRLLNILPRPLLVGAAFAVPLVAGGILADTYGSGYEVLRRSVVVSVVLGYILTRRPEAR
ncbi:MAG: hypothetical protein JXC32_00320 [Anaerolineae bacterium]|nr:hypothetical protein [Anaerolineae bacterium]